MMISSKSYNPAWRGVCVKKSKDQLNLRTEVLSGNYCIGLQTLGTGYRSNTSPTVSGDCLRYVGSR